MHDDIEYVTNPCVRHYGNPNEWVIQFDMNSKFAKHARMRFAAYHQNLVLLWAALPVANINKQQKSEMDHVFCLCQLWLTILDWQLQKHDRNPAAADTVTKCNQVLTHQSWLKALGKQLAVDDSPRITVIPSNEKLSHAELKCHHVRPRAYLSDKSWKSRTMFHHGHRSASPRMLVSNEGTQPRHPVTIDYCRSKKLLKPVYTKHLRSLQEVMVDSNASVGSWTCRPKLHTTTESGPAKVVNNKCKVPLKQGR